MQLRTKARLRVLRLQVSRLQQPSCKINTSSNSIFPHLSQRRLTSSTGCAKRTVNSSATSQSTTTNTHNISAASPQAIPLPATAPTIPVWQRLGPLTWAIRGFGRSQRRRPYVTQFVSTLVIYFLGDLGAQGIRVRDARGRDGEGRYEAERTVKALVIGAGSGIPTYLWFLHLSTHYNYRSLLLSLATKVSINQLLYTPIFNTYFFGMQSLLTFIPILNRSASSPHHDPAKLLTKEGWTQVRDHVVKTVPTSFVNSCKLWPAVTAVNFWIVPVEFRAVSAGLVAVGWQTYLSFLNRRAEREEEEEGGDDGVLVGGEKLGSTLVAGGRCGEEGRKGM